MEKSPEASLAQPDLDGDEGMPLQRVYSDSSQDMVHRLRIFYGTDAVGMVIQTKRGLALVANEGLVAPVQLDDEATVLHDSLTRRVPSVIFDASADSRYQEDPLVAGPRGLRFVVRAPLLTKDQDRVGTLFIADRKTRFSFTLQEGEELMEAAASISDLLSMGPMGHQMCPAEDQPIIRVSGML